MAKVILYTFSVLMICSCATSSIDLHVKLKEQSYTVFEKFTESEKSIMTESIGQRIDRNQQSCGLRIDAINKVIRKHNSEHDDK